MKNNAVPNIAVFASGSGTNAEALIRHFKTSGTAQVALVVTNKPDAGVIKRAETLGVPWMYIPKADLDDEELLMSMLEEYSIRWVALAGWMILVPAYLVKHFRHRMVNIHPALLPRHGGKGMYGHHVHEAVKASGDAESGITVHVVNERYDEGKILRQERVAILPTDSAEDIERKVRELELKHYPSILEKAILADAK